MCIVWLFVVGLPWVWCLLSCDCAGGGSGKRCRLSFSGFEKTVGWCPAKAAGDGEWARRDQAQERGTQLRGKRSMQSKDWLLHLHASTKFSVPCLPLFYFSNSSSYFFLGSVLVQLCHCRNLPHPLLHLHPHPLPCLNLARTRHRSSWHGRKQRY